MKPTKLSDLPSKPWWIFGVRMHWLLGLDSRCKHYREFQALQAETKEKTFYICCGCLRTWQQKREGK